MAKLLLNSVSNLGNLMNVGSRNYASYSPAIDRLIGYLSKTEINHSGLNRIRGFDVVNIDKNTNSVKLVKALGSEKLKVKFNLKNFIDTEVFWWKNESIGKHLNSKSTELFASDNINLNKLTDLVVNKTFFVELDKEQDKNLVMMCVLSQSKKKFDPILIQMMSKKDADQKIEDKVLQEHWDLISDIFVEKGFEGWFINGINKWCDDLEKTETKKYESLNEIKDFLIS